MVEIFKHLILIIAAKLSVTYAAVQLVNDTKPIVNVQTSGPPVNDPKRNVTDIYTTLPVQVVQQLNDNTSTLQIKEANYSKTTVGVNSEGLIKVNNFSTIVPSADTLFDNESYDTNNTTPVDDISHALNNFPADIMPEWLRNNGGVLFHVFILAYCCLGLGVVCDLYFLPALDIISKKLSLSPDIAGATFMAIGTSAPELFTSIIGVFVSQDDIGIGTILGTAVFNLIVIPAACGFAVILYCPKTPEISRFPILRDSIFYILTIVTLILCIKDNRVDWVESLILISMFGIYLVIMYFNAQYSHRLTNTGDMDEKTPLLEGSTLEKAHKEWNGNSSLATDEDIMESAREMEDQNSHILSTSGDYRARSRSASQKRILLSETELEEEEDWIESSCFFKWLLFPMTLLFKITLPKPTKLCFIITFLISIIWIGSLTYVCVWMVTIIGYTFGLPDTVSGLTLLAAGTSVPELISSVLVVKKASQADMAICNSIGSNIFDILFCLGVPWFLKSVIWMFQKGTFSLEATAVPIDSTALPLTTFSLLVTIFALLATFQATKWKLGLTVGITCSIIYVIFCIISSLLEIKLE
ncbi:unnamed protein product, partial [Medioppia subpectinata]